MNRLLLYRLVIAAPLLLVVSVLTFVLVSFSPGDAASTILGASATAEQLAALRNKLGLDLPLYVQYFNWVAGALGGDFGSSLLNGQPVLAAMAPRVWPTISLVGLTMLITVVFGVALGVAGAVFGGFLGRAVDVISMAGIAIPNFVLGVGLAAVLAVWLRVLPPGGYVAPAVSLTDWARSMIMPVACLSFFSIGLLAKQVRASVSDVLQSEFAFSLIANGFRRHSIIFRHALKNSALPVLAVSGVIFSGLLSGTVLVESVFYIPGLGSLAVAATVGNDLPVVQGVTVFFTLTVIIINLLLDLAYGALNPKLQAHSK